eukprot:397273_1
MATVLRQLSRRAGVHSLQRTSQAISRPIQVSLEERMRVGCSLGPVSRPIHTSPIICDDTATTSIPPRDSVFGFDEDHDSMSNDELNDPSTIPGFASLIHSPPRDRTTTPRNAIVGYVVSDKMDKTVNVAVDRYRIVPKYRKRLKYTKKFMAHDEKEVCQEGDLVMIVPCQKLSRKKHFMVHEIVKFKGSIKERMEMTAAKQQA